MARLEYISPLSEHTFASAHRVSLDSHISVVTSDEAAGALSYVITGASTSSVWKDGVGVNLTFGAGELVSAVITIADGPTTEVVQRVNRLLKGLEPKVELLWYHRTKDVRLHVPGGWLALPAEVSYKPGDGLFWRVPGSMWTNESPAPVRKARSSPVRASGTAPEPKVAPSATPVPVAAPAPPSPLLSASGDVRGLFKFPVLSKRNEVIVKADVAAGLDSLWALHTGGHRQVIAIVGPTGTGKTSLAYNLAARHNVGIMTFDSAGAREFSDWVGTTHLREGRTEFIPSGFLTAIDADGPYGGQHRIVLVDEVNRAESSGALNALVPVLHGFGTLYVPELGRGVSIDPTAMVILTANRGSQYGGTVGLDLALIDRVTAWVKMEYIDETRERALLIERYSLSWDKADNLVKAAIRVREAAQRGELPEGGGVSTRRLMQAAEKAAGDFTLHAAASWTWVGAYSDEGGTSSESTIVKAAIDAVLRGL